MEHGHDNPVASFENARVNKSNIYVTTHEGKAPVNAANTQNTESQEYLKAKTVICLVAKVSIPGKSTISCNQGIINYTLE